MTVRAFRQAADAAPAIPNLTTELPGPRARELIARDAAVTSPSLTRAYPLAPAPKKPAKAATARAT